MITEERMTETAKWLDKLNADARNCESNVKSLVHWNQYKGATTAIQTLGYEIWIDEDDKHTIVMI